MARLEKLAVTWNGLVKAFEKHVGDWKPPKLKTEVNYRDHLLAYLRDTLPQDTKVEREYRHLGTTLDLWVGWKGVFAPGELAFELKVNLKKKKTDYDRLVGQIEGINPRKNKTLVVLIGETDQGLLGRLKERYEEQIKSTTDVTLAIVQVVPG